MKYKILVWGQIYEPLKKDLFYLGPLECKKKLCGSLCFAVIPNKNSLFKQFEILTEK